MNYQASLQAEFVPIGEGLRAYYAAPATRGPGLLLFQEIFGINEHIQYLCRRFAAAGYATIAPDFFGGKTFSYGGEDIEERKKALFDDDFAQRAIAAAIAFLDGRDDADETRLGAVGFCMGGRLAFLTAETFADRLGAAISFYGGGIGETRGPGRPALLDGVDAIRAPLLLAYGANDKSIGPDEHARVAQALSAAGKRYTLDVYGGAGHAFMRDVGSTYHEASAREAWATSLAFFARHLGTEGPA